MAAAAAASRSEAAATGGAAAVAAAAIAAGASRPAAADALGATTRDQAGAAAIGGGGSRPAAADAANRLAVTMTSGDDAARRNCTRAIRAALTGDWEQAHVIVQDLDDPLACWIHAILHKIEGDAWNSRYWYERSRGHQYQDHADARSELLAALAEADRE